MKTMDCEFFISLIGFMALVVLAIMGVCSADGEVPGIFPIIFSSILAGSVVTVASIRAIEKKRK